MNVMKSSNPKPKIERPLVKSSNTFPVVGIGASAGGLEAFKKLLHAIPENSNLAYVLVQHLNPDHESLLPELLQKMTTIPVLEITNAIKVFPNNIYIIPANKLLVANDGVLQLSPRSSNKTKQNLPIDLFFASLAEVYQSHAIGVILSGTASDGTQGLKAIKDNGGITFAQDENSATFDGMPNSAVRAGVVDFILPPEKIPSKILELTNIIIKKDPDDQAIPQQDEDVFRQIIALLRVRKGTDFAHYKQTTIRRRILRRMAFNKNEEPAPYLQFLRQNKAEQDMLYQDLLIPVTNFFRDPKSFQNLCEWAFPGIIKSKEDGEPIRIWVAGCSTGEEVYSIAICLKEFLNDDSKRVQIFATDISEPAIIKARSGVYTKGQVDAVASQRLRDFFDNTDGSFKVKKKIRDMCIFALHNFLKDPPFGKMDLISCRNVLIYMEPYLQKKALSTFHYALNPKGFLLLGKSETTGSVSELFAPSVKHDKIFVRKNLPGRYMIMATAQSEQNFRDINNNIKTDNSGTDFQKTADDIILTKYTPVGVVVNEALDIVHFRGNSSDYFEQAAGKPTHNLLKLAKFGLSFELRNIVHKAKKEKSTVIKESIPVEINGILRNITIEALPLPNTIEPHYLILFYENQSPYPPSTLKAAAKLKKDEKDARIRQLENELSQIREDMRSITEDQEAANEELQSANEELLSGSEELQSLNEELETGKEELQSTNEELIVVNNELFSLNEQVTVARNFSEAIIANLREPVIVLDMDLRIKSCNKAFYSTFLVNEQETEGRLFYELENQQWNIPALRAPLENILPARSKFSDFEVNQTFSDIGQRNLLFSAYEIKRETNSERLILLSIQDVTESKLAKEKPDKNIELAKMNKELQSFAYVSSHDLQEPLRKIQTYATRILEKEHQSLSDSVKDYLHRMQDAAKRMQRLIDDLLSFSRVSSGDRIFEKTDLNKVLEEVKTELKDVIEEKQATIEVVDMCEANIIPFQFRQLMHNLIGNSLKFSKPGTPPYIIIRSSYTKYDKSNSLNIPVNNQYCHLNITDNGVGFDPEFKEKIFEVFQRLHNKEEYPGTGIGLAIVKKVVENHNGIITANSEINKGSSFDIFIPAL